MHYTKACCHHRKRFLVQILVRYRARAELSRISEQSNILNGLVVYRKKVPKKLEDAL